jgi:ABC-type uncharacterized transport system permease subunit
MIGGLRGSMLSGVQIICFAASYAVALAMEVSRPLFRSGLRGAVMLGFAGAGLFAHTAFLLNKAVAAQGSPLSSEQDWYLLAAWVLVATYLYLIYYYPRTAFGLFLLPLALGLVGTATFFADPTPYAQGPASKVWGLIHGTSILLATVSVLIGFAAGLMYFGQARRLKHKRPPTRGLRLPSLEWLQRANSRAIVISVLMLGVGVISGMMLKRINHAGQSGRLPWHDPVVLSTELMLAWLLIAAVVGGLYKPARAGRKVAYLTVVSFVFLVIVLGVQLLLNTQHGGRSQGPGAGGQGSGSRTSGDSYGVCWDLHGNRGRGLVPLIARPTSRATVRWPAPKGDCSTLPPVPFLLAEIPHERAGRWL